MKTTVWFCAAALFVPGLAGCGGSSPTNTSGPILLKPLSVSVPLSNGLTATLTEDRSTVSVGGTVTYTATLTNSTAQPVTYQSFIYPTVFGTVPASLLINNSSSQTVYPAGPISAAVANGPVVTLAPGQSVSAAQIVSTKNDPGLTASQGYAAAGQYTANAFFSVSPTMSSANSQPGTANVALSETAQ